MATDRKVKASAGGAGIGGALAVIVGYVIQQTTGEVVPTEVELALSVVLSAVIAFAAGYLTPASRDG